MTIYILFIVCPQSAAEYARWLTTHGHVEILLLLMTGLLKTAGQYPQSYFGVNYFNRGGSLATRTAGIGR